jgi:ubiquinone/menaquinone biosynthesis C-methylase UbiE
MHEANKMDIRQAYDQWAEQYDSNDNKTRDLEALALRETLNPVSFDHCLEIGCGTGKNTAWLLEKAKKVTAVDLSEKMLTKAKQKIHSDKVQFLQADITGDWVFGTGLYDLVSFSLVLEHIEDLDHIFKETAAALKPAGHVYIGELHPFKQYTGSKARFDTAEGLQVVDCFDHHIADFTRQAKKHNFSVADINEYFDNNKRNELPRILSLLLKKD